jgi:hypothetical protein
MAKKKARRLVGRPLRKRPHQSKSARSRYRSEYATWMMIRQRCRNPRCQDYPRYGGRGIDVAKRWDSFEKFLEDLGPRPKGYSLVRKSPDAGFSPSTCSWRPRAEQQRHRSANRLAEKDVIRIRERYAAGVGRADLARRYEVSLSHICHIIAGTRWKPTVAQRTGGKATRRRRGGRTAR